jgi:hypothetical protein
MKNQITTIKIDEGAFLNEVEPFASQGIPTDCILHKVIPGCGATSLEIKYTQRNSIIIVPNVPVIEEKVAEHNKKHPADQRILGVYREIGLEAIEDYINSEVTYKKIITTPEGFMKKVLLAFENDLERLKSEYFLLIDECERVVTDISYRGSIAAPISWFFKFEQKAMVSATTVPFSHSGFSKFHHIIVEPTYDFCKNIDLICTNNVIESLQRHLAKVTDDKPVFIFVNSIETIAAIINILQIKDDSHVYCADKSVAKLVVKKIRTGYSKLDVKHLAKYNFLTSRYFSAFDLILDYQPDVVLVTDVFTSPHSILDPQTEVIQISGRFRKGLNSITQITNFNAEIESKTKEESLQYLKGCFDTYESIVTSFKNAKDQGSIDTLQFFLDNSPIAKYYSEGEVNQFMIDNFIHEERVKGYYQHESNLIKAYSQVDKHFKLTILPEEYLLSDEDRNNRELKTRVRDQQWETLEQIDRLTHKPSPLVPGEIRITITMPNSKELLLNLRSFYPWLTEAYDLLGLEGLKKTGLSATKINPAKAKANEIKQLKRLAPFVYDEFDEHTTPNDTDIKEAMPKLCRKANVELRPTISLILKFFEGDRTTKSGVHVHALREKKDLTKLTPFDQSN